ncbi:MAG: Ku70/Ku80 beta-barrel domain protein [Methanoregula sp. PtaU1.Bin006]|nr:MAG: Ku70/Ku80 beta-barrel domain protein [Methanoregula sp. PtaB.Bin085]OPY32227.1 MAG: Ku70/Ku80 beta-barrel domain protein [Methanoregula sp. PtaU1.Bin006]
MTGRKSPESPPPAKQASHGKRSPVTKPASMVKTEHLPAGGEEHGAQPGRAFWSGSITIGLVNVPVRLHTMVRDRSFAFRLLHRDDGQPLKYDRVCSRDGKVVPWSETVKGYEIRKGEFLVFEPDELKAILPESDRKIRIDKFVYYLSLDPVYFDSSFILVPDRSEEAYGLLLAALQDLGRAAAGTITLRTKEYPAIVHVYDGALVLTTLRHADEVIPPHAFSILPELPVPKAAELALAKKIVTDLSGDFSINDYPDRYREAVLALVHKKLAGENIVYEEPHPGQAKELMQALQETIATLAKK